MFIRTMADEGIGQRINLKHSTKSLIFTEPKLYLFASVCESMGG